MTRRRNLTAKLSPVRFDGAEHWFSIERAAALIGTTTAKLDTRARAGEFAFEADDHGNPCWFRQSDITPLHLAKLQAAREKAKRPPRPKTPAQLEAEWARISEANKRPAHDGLFVDHHLRTTLRNSTKKVE
ncbi:hypothetical protein [Sphingomonas sp. HMP6]|uniref:hypothetical protein n=1 Tax=Sphingomonas sp. HMP6 TaxID=1517551 RepID=UPI001596ACB6|nr:hypothetical protein [Sphingomonas sp. HMP6]BCA59296.1 hypothetical protein HMP06_2065 [Sphingomonas sp. HMP6]